jgi:hypothetical protein
MSTQLREDLIRSFAKWQGLVLMNLPRRNPDPLDPGIYVLIDQHTNKVVLGGDQRASLDEVEVYLEDH